MMWRSSRVLPPPDLLPPSILHQGYRPIVHLDGLHLIRPPVVYRRVPLLHELGEAERGEVLVIVVRRVAGFRICRSQSPYLGFHLTVERAGSGSRRPVAATAAPDILALVVVVDLFSRRSLLRPRDRFLPTPPAPDGRVDLVPPRALLPVRIVRRRGRQRRRRARRGSSSAGHRRRRCPPDQQQRGEAVADVAAVGREDQERHRQDEVEEEGRPRGRPSPGRGGGRRRLHGGGRGGGIRAVPPRPRRVVVVVSIARRRRRGVAADWTAIVRRR
mmetsp:Transcript_14545/g.35059  ORF Transcript_14545/g.35059 Transcript_14545/m.35059 type:complete len:273 (-) Transcript_14545:64-882(-)